MRDDIDELFYRVRRLERDIIAALLVSGIVGIAFAIHQSCRDTTS